MSPVSPLKSPGEELEDLLKACDNLDDLSLAEDLTEGGLRRLGRALMQRTAQRLADREASGKPEDFSPSSGP